MNKICDKVFTVNVIVHRSQFCAGMWSLSNLMKFLLRQCTLYLCPPDLSFSLPSQNSYSTSLSSWLPLSSCSSTAAMTQTRSSFLCCLISSTTSSIQKMENHLLLLLRALRCLLSVSLLRVSVEYFKPFSLTTSP